MVMSSSSLEPREAGTAVDAAASSFAEDVNIRSPERSPELSSPPASFARLTRKRPEAGAIGVVPAASGSGEISEEPLLRQEEHTGKGNQPPVVTDAARVVEKRAPSDGHVSHLEAPVETRTTTCDPGGRRETVTKEESERRYGRKVGGGGHRPDGESYRGRAANAALDEKWRIDSDRRDGVKDDPSDTDANGGGEGDRDGDMPPSAPVLVPAASAATAAESFPEGSLVVLNERQSAERFPTEAGVSFSIGGEDLTAGGGRDDYKNGPSEGVPGQGSGVGGGPIPGAAKNGGESSSCSGGRNGKPLMEKAAAAAIGSDRGEGGGAAVDLLSSDAGEGGGEVRSLLQQQDGMGVSHSITDVENLPPPSLLRSTSKYLHEDLAEAKRKQIQRARAKRHKKISFADEHGDAIHMTQFQQVLYYSKDGVPTPNGRGCCTIS